MGIIKEYVDSILPPFVSGVWSVDEMMLNVKKTKKTGKDGCRIRLKQSNLSEFF